MLTKPRPQTAVRRPLTAVPKQMVDNFQNEQTTQNTNKQTLNNLIPDMPAFLSKNKSSTALLYSKFIMKGIKTNKIDLVKESFNMKKQNLKYEKKMSLNLMKTIRSTRNSTNKDALKSIRNQNNEKTDCLQKSQFNLDDSKMLNLEINNFFRINSNRKQPQQNQTQRKLINIQSQKIIHRPKSAVTTPYKVARSNRAQTANYRKSTNSANRQTFLEYDDFKPAVPERNLLTIIESQRPGFGYTNFIQRNKRELSATSKKTSIYLTGIDGNKPVEKQIRKVPAKRYEQIFKCHAIKKSMPELNEQNEFDFTKKDARLSQQQIEDIKKTNKKNVVFMKKHMPEQYKKFVEYEVMQQNNYTQKDRLLLSINLQNNPNEFGQINLNTKNQDEAMDQARDYFNEYAHICEQTQYYINKNLKKKQQPKTFNQVLHVENCQELMELQKQRKYIKDKNQNLSQDNAKRLKQINLKILQIVRILSFFKSKSQQVCNKIFQLQFSIFSVDQDQTIINQGDSINLFYVILNGSVVKQSRNQSSQQSETILTSVQTTLPQTYTNTLFDGQSFGQPDNLFQTSHKHQYKSAEKVLLLAFPYINYKNICSESQNISEKIQMLKTIFGSVPGCKSLNNQNLQALAFQLESSSYEAKNIIFRKQDPCDKLIIVASGKIAMANEHILKRAKKNSKDMKKKHSSKTKLKIKNYSVEKLRRNNLKNYQVLNQNQQEFIFYYQDIAKEFIRGDVINWEGFSYNYRKSMMDQQQSVIQRQSEATQNTQSNSSQYKLEYSLISNTDNTKIYTLNMKRIQNLPEMLKEVIYAKIDDAMKKNKSQKKPKLQIPQPSSIEKWDSYKQKICNDIITRKLKV